MSSYPEPIPLVSGDVLVTRGGDSHSILLVRERGSNEFRLPGATYFPGQFKNPFEAGEWACRHEVSGLNYLNKFHRFAVLAQSGRGPRCYNGWYMDSSLSFVSQTTVYGHPTPMRSANIEEAVFVHSRDIPSLPVGWGQKRILYEWFSAVTSSNEMSFRYLRHEGPAAVRSEGVASGEKRNFKYPVPVITSTLIARRLTDPWQIAFVQLRGQPGSLCLPGGIFDWGRHDDPFKTAERELLEETGLEPLAGIQLFGMSLRTGVDRREFRGVQTDHCIDHLFTTMVNDRFAVGDIAEIEGAKFYDITGMDLSCLARGHQAIMEEYRYSLRTGEMTRFRWIE